MTIQLNSEVIRTHGQSDFTFNQVGTVVYIDPEGVFTGPNNRDYRRPALFFVEFKNNANRVTKREIATKDQLRKYTAGMAFVNSPSRDEDVENGDNVRRIRGPSNFSLNKKGKVMFVETIDPLDHNGQDYKVPAFIGIRFHNGEKNEIATIDQIRLMPDDEEEEEKKKEEPKVIIREVIREREREPDRYLVDEPYFLLEPVIMGPVMGPVMSGLPMSPVIEVPYGPVVYSSVLPVTDLPYGQTVFADDRLFFGQ
jgi:hypothetical protein